MQNTLHNAFACAACKNFLSCDARQGDIVCTHCGLVCSSHMLVSRPGFAVKPAFAPKKTTTGSTERGPRRLNIDDSDENRMEKIRAKVYSLISELALNNDLLGPRAMRIYRELVEKECPRVKKDELLATACVFVALRQSHTPFSFNELVNRCNNVSKRELGRCCKRCYVFLQKQNEHTRAITVFENVPRYASNLGFNRLEIMLLNSLTKTVEKSGIIRGNNTLSIVAAVFLFVAQKIGMTRITIKRVAAVLNVAENTVTKAIQYLKNDEEKIFTDEVQKKVKKCIKKRIL